MSCGRSWVGLWKMGSSQSKKLGVIVQSQEPISTAALTELWNSYAQSASEQTLGLPYGKAKRFLMQLCSVLNVWMIR